VLTRQSLYKLGHYPAPWKKAGHGGAQVKSQSWGGGDRGSLRLTGQPVEPNPDKLKAGLRR